jgi:hypothetical protein
LGGREILWGKRNFGDCKRIFEQTVVEALPSISMLSNNNHDFSVLVQCTQVNMMLVMLL